MARKSKGKQSVGLTDGLGSSELEVLDMVWHRGQVTVREMFEEVRKKRAITLPAVMLSMNRLVKRGLLQKRPGQQGAVYQPVQSREQVASSLLSDLIDRVLQGSAGAVLSSLAERLSDEELAKLAELTNERRSS